MCCKIGQITMCVMNRYLKNLIRGSLATANSFNFYSTQEIPMAFAFNNFAHFFVTKVICDP